MSASAAGAEESSTDEDARPEGSRRLNALLPGLVVALVLSLAAAAYSGWQWREADQREDQRSEVMERAADLAVEVTSYDYRTIDDYLDNLKAVSTGDFGDNYQTASPDLRELVVKSESVVGATVVDSGLESLSDDSAVVILFVDQVVRNKGLEKPRTDRNRVRMTLTRTGDEDWLISELELK